VDEELCVDVSIVNFIFLILAVPPFEKQQVDPKHTSGSFLSLQHRLIRKQVGVVSVSS
jgi:hypothetical protein